MMQTIPSGLLICVLVSLACSGPRIPPLDDAGGDPPETGVRALAEAISQDLARLGPTGWLLHFQRDSAFYMASDGRLVFPNIQSADAAIATMAKTTRSMELTWLKVRVDSLGPAVAGLSSPFEEFIIDTSGKRQEYRGYFSATAVRVDSGWTLRNLHWSLASGDRVP